jgi:RND family efflux transporter MFP subunit
MSRHQFQRLERSGLLIIAGVAALVFLVGHSVAADDAVVIEIPNAYLTSRRTMEIAAQASGPVAELLVDEGSHVKAGEVLLQMETAEEKNTVTRARLSLQIAEKTAQSDAALKLATATHRHSAAELQRAEELLQKNPGTISPTELSDLRLEVDRSTQQLRRAEEERELSELTRQVRQAELELAELSIRRRQIAAPIAGVVTQVYRQQGEWVQAGEKVLRLVQLDQLVARASIGIQHQSRDLTGAEAWLTAVSGDSGPAGAERRYRGRVTFVNPEVNAINREFEIRAEFENSDYELSPGLRVHLRVMVRNSPKQGTLERDGRTTGGSR